MYSPSPVHANLIALMELWLRRKAMGARYVNKDRLTTEYCIVASQVATDLGMPVSEWIHTRLSNRLYRHFITEGTSMSVDVSLWTISSAARLAIVPAGNDACRLMAAINHLYHVMLR